MKTSRPKSDAIDEYRVVFVPLVQRLGRRGRSSFRSLNRLLGTFQRKSIGNRGLPPLGEGVPITIEDGEFAIHLNVSGLEQITVARQQRLVPQVSDPLLQQLRHYALFEESEIRGQNGKLRKVVTMQSGLTFQTYWYGPSSLPTHLQTGNRRSGQRALKTIVSLDGDILNQIRREYVNHPYGYDIAMAHYWLVGQLLQSIRSRISATVNKIVWAVPAVCIGWNTVTNLGGLINQVNPDAISRIVLSFLSFAVPLFWEALHDRIMPVVMPPIKRWTLAQLLNPTSPFQSLARLMFRG
ncbi:MAG: hypothetical protein SFW36_23470 [Leptolyngbyaceae cyanobacterium bins.59]|nr:hypothetical protein [Leptolyngbyaceae cyanobacterium bins.59]